MSAASEAVAPAAPSAAPGPPRSEERRRTGVPHAVMGTLIFIVTELMVFAGMVSAFNIVKSRSPAEWWPPPTQPRLPVEATAVNTGVLLLSGVVMFLAARAWSKDPARGVRLLRVAVGLGATFVIVQGTEWYLLIEQGLSMTVSAHSAFFCLIIGCHALHAIGALVALVWVLRRMGRGVATQGQFQAAQAFWYFVVGVWPILYARVYLL